MGRALCERHGTQPLKNVCPHVVPGGPGTLVGMMDGFIQVLACDACVANYAVTGNVPKRLEEDFGAILVSWCLRCWDDAARGEPASPL